MTSLTALRLRLNSIVAHLTSRDFGGMETLTKKTLDNKRGYTYTYYVSPAKAGKPTVLLCHGFPDHAAQWEDLATKHLVPAGYGVVIPDLLGYDGTSKPTDPNEYAWDKMTADLCEILDAEKIDKVVSAGHDWGAPMAQAVYKFHPERVIGLITMNVAYLPQLEGPFALEVVRPMITQAVGYFPQWYWYLFSHPREGPEISDAHVESFFEACHDQPEAWMDTLCTKDGLKNWLLQDKKANNLLPYATDDFKKAWVGRLKRDGFTAPFMWYRGNDRRAALQRGERAACG